MQTERNILLGGYDDPETGKHYDLWFRPKPEDPAEGFCDAIVVVWTAWSGDENDPVPHEHSFIGTAETYRITEFHDPVLRAVRVGHLLAKDRGLLKTHPRTTMFITIGDADREAIREVAGADAKVIRLGGEAALPWVWDTARDLQRDKNADRVIVVVGAEDAEAAEDLREELMRKEAPEGSVLFVAVPLRASGSRTRS